MSKQKYLTSMGKKERLTGTIEQLERIIARKIGPKKLKANKGKFQDSGKRKVQPTPIPGAQCCVDLTNPTRSNNTTTYELGWHSLDEVIATKKRARANAYEMTTQKGRYQATTIIGFYNLPQETIK
jgi:hypothetical protein